MEFQVPQFIEVEDKIFGPLTIFQFIYVVGGVGFAVVMWLTMPLWAAILLGGPIAALGIGLAFVKVNDRPLMVTLEAAADYFFSSKLYIWEKKKKPISVAQDLALPGENRDDPAKYVPAATGTKIKDLSWSLDVKEHAFGAPDGSNAPQGDR